ncbi:hypothetical protein GGI1_10178 [Acidithiobacillus sp. GGI-221]|nr:hypothetical protein GGI1_10178 [Acidithiobacillus sp. GGI-221]
MSKIHLRFEETREYEKFTSILNDLTEDLGNAFPVSIQAWCGLAQRNYPLLDWHVFLAIQPSGCIGLYSHYRQPDDPDQRFWVGWIGVSPAFRRQGVGSMLLQHIEHTALLQGHGEIWVYTDNTKAMTFYEANGYQVIGGFPRDTLRQNAANNASVVLKKTMPGI